jgi:hypothetical protein
MLNEALEQNKWKPGQSGNPAGRPRGASVVEHLKQLLNVPEDKPLESGDARKIARALLQVALDPDHPKWDKAVDKVLDRIDGPLRQEIAAIIEAPKVISLEDRPEEGSDAPERPGHD